MPLDRIALGRLGRALGEQYPAEEALPQKIQAELLRLAGAEARADDEPAQDRTSDFSRMCFSAA
jgi:hypothetical protein